MINKNFKKLSENYLFQELALKRNELIKQGKDVIALAIGDPDLETPMPIREAMAKEILEVYHKYPESEGMLELRQALSQYYKKRFKVNMPADNIFISFGAKTDLFDVVRVFSNTEDVIAVQDPAYPVYENSILFEGRNIKYLPCIEENNFLPDLNLLDKNIALAYLCYPNNPTGATAPKSYLAELIKKLKQINALLIYDIAYADFGPRMAPSIFSIPGAKDIALEFGSFSKPYSMTGYRLSWFAAKNPEIVKYWQKFRNNRDSGCSNYIQKAGITALTSPEVEKIVRKNMAEYSERAKLLKTGFEKLTMQVFGLEHTPYAWVSIPKGYTSKSFAEKLLNEAYVIVTPGSGFGPSGEGYVRATIFQPKAKIEEALERIGRLKL